MADYRSTGKELRKSPKGLIAGGIAVVLFIFGIYGVKRIWGGLAPIQGEDSVAEGSSELDIPIPSETSVTDENQIVYSYEALFRTEMARGALVLVNREYAIEDLTEGLVSVYEHRGEHFTVKDTEVQLLETCVTALDELTKGFYEATGHEDLQVITGYRDKAYQQKLYNNRDTTLPAIEQTPEAGHSEHETGLAIDFNIYDHGVTATFDGTGDYAWVAEHCADYGFILRYPAEKTSLTGFAAEPWHFRYVGKPHAAYMQAHDLCLEQYLTLLQGYTYEGEHLQLQDVQGNLYEAYYVPAVSEDATEVVEIPVAANRPYTLSGDNCGGFIVTVETGERAE